MEKRYKFIFHYYKDKDMMILHFRKKTYYSKNIECNVKCETKWSDTHPKLVLEGYAKELVQEKDKIVLL